MIKNSENINEDRAAATVLTKVRKKEKVLSVIIKLMKYFIPSCCLRQMMIINTPAPNLNGCWIW